MALSMFQASVPVYIKMLNGLANCLKKGAAHYSERKLDEGSLLNYRLFPDMFTFAKQVQEATNHARNVVRLAGQEPPKVEENEKSLAELIARVEKTVEFMNTLKPAQIDGTEDKVDHAHASRCFRGLQRIPVPDAAVDPELLFSLHHGLQHPAAQRRRGWEAGLF